MSRPPIAADRLALIPSSQIRYQLKTAYRDGTTHIVVETPDLIVRFAALTRPPRMHLMRCRGIFAPIVGWLRAAVTAVHCLMSSKGQGAHRANDQPATPRHVPMTWAQRLKCVFGIEINTCSCWGGRLKVMASIEEPEVIASILAHLEKATRTG